MVPIFLTSTQTNLLIYVGGGGFVLLGAFYFGRLVTFFFPNNPLIKKGKKENEELTPKQKEFVEFLEKASNQSKENNDAWSEIKFWFRWCWNEIQDHWDFSDLWLKRNRFYLVFFLFRSHLKLVINQLFVYRYRRVIWKCGPRNYYLRIFWRNKIWLA